MTSRSRARTRAKTKNGLLWWLTWPLHVAPRWVGWWVKEFLVGLAIGLCQGVRIGWYEIRAAKIVKRCKESDTKIYDLDVWELLRSITFERQRNKTGVVVCSGCHQPTDNPHCHHIKHVAYHPKLAFSPWNLTGLCPPCHQNEHPTVQLSPAPLRKPLTVPGVRRARKLRQKHRALRPKDLLHV